MIRLLKNQINSACIFAQQHTKFTLITGFLMALFGTVFSIDKQLDIINYKEEILQLQEEVQKANRKAERINEFYKRSSLTWNKEKCEMLILLGRIDNHDCENESMRQQNDVE